MKNQTFLSRVTHAFVLLACKYIIIKICIAGRPVRFWYSSECEISESCTMKNQTFLARATLAFVLLARKNILFGINPAC